MAGTSIAVSFKIHHLSPSQNPQGLYLLFVFLGVETTRVSTCFKRGVDFASSEVVLMLARLPIGKLALLGRSPGSLMGGILQNLHFFWDVLFCLVSLSFSLGCFETGVFPELFFSILFRSGSFAFH